MIGWVIALTVVAVLGIAGGIGWSKLSKEHREARSLPLNAVDFSRLSDGTYHGSYEGGMYKWRANECQVTVSSGRVTNIRLVGSQDPGGENTQHEALYDRVIEAQSLQVDTISSATLTSKAYLQAVENALIQAQHE
ncbi:MAG: FMN-binding protein [Chloroflexota bacterium]|nr:FMN-binding protein [Chloroflexota bacterium]